MSTAITINGQPFQYPDAGELPGWGEEATAAFLALAAQVQGISPATDIILSQASINNNISIPTTIANLEFDSSLIFGAILEFTIRRSNNSLTMTEQGVIELAYSNGVWYMDRSQLGTDTGVTFSITNGGLFQYMSSAIGATNYAGTMTFRVRSFPITL